MCVYPVKVMMEGVESTILLKLDVKTIRRLQTETGKEILDILMDAPSNPAAMGDLLEAAVHFTNNHNPQISGDDLYELLVESGKCGVSDWLEIVNGIATASGILQSAHGTAMVTSVRRRMEKVIAKLESGDDEEDVEEPVPPTKQKAGK